MPTVLATTQDVAVTWRPLTPAETTQAASLLVKASAKLRQKCPFDIDARMALFATTPTDRTALDPAIVADVVATMVKRVLSNRDGVASSSATVGPYSKSQTFVNRYDKTGSDVRGALQVTDSDIEQLRPAVPAQIPSSFAVMVPEPQLLIPRHVGNVADPLGIGVEPVIAPDIAIGSGVE